MPYLAAFIRLIFCSSLLLDFPCAFGDHAKFSGQFVLNVRCVSRVAHPRNHPPVPFPASFIRLVLLRS